MKITLKIGNMKKEEEFKIKIHSRNEVDLVSPSRVALVVMDTGKALLGPDGFKKTGMNTLIDFGAKVVVLPKKILTELKEIVAYE